MGLPFNVLMIKTLILMLKPGLPDSLTPTLYSSLGPLRVNGLCNAEISSLNGLGDDIQKQAAFVFEKQFV